ncbi:hypothetical protein [Bifidobacterium sp. SO1]|uniref:hypothetical protein n=1 Tax=Bifidobacterium sp. SO1 TaxID=2809029 RepID=UPI001BDDB679|nr:hypothetical protein [Bifidobacterium sp. SO1]MBT1161205.1 hypothetical protein [Bifidobacterium sp. SO1]
MPAALRELDGGLLWRLMTGLAGYDESLYREWLLDHPDRQPAPESDGTPMLSYHRYTQDTSLLLGLYNNVGALVAGLLTSKNGKHPEFTPILPPGNRDDGHAPGGSATFDSMKAFLGG